VGLIILPSQMRGICSHSCSYLYAIPSYIN